MSIVQPFFYIKGTLYVKIDTTFCFCEVKCICVAKAMFISNL